MMQINTDTGEITNNQIPIFLTGLLPDSLSNLSWTDESLGVRHLRFLDIVQVITPEFDSETQKLSEPVYTLNDASDGIVMTYSIDNLSVNDIAAKQKALVPSEVQMWQARAILEQSGYKAQIDAALANDIVARNKWEYATVVKRTDDIVVGMAALLSLTELQIDDLFIAASKL